MGNLGKHMENNYIKTADLCERCRYSQYRAPCAREGCNESCKMFSIFGCRCRWIKQNTPCPYFEERKE